MSWLSNIWNWLRGEIAVLVGVLKPYLSAYSKNLRDVGIKDVAGFLAAAEPIALAAGGAAFAGGAVGADIMKAVVAALKPIAVQYGASLSADALNSVLNTTAEMLHQPAVADRSDPAAS